MKGDARERGSLRALNVLTTHEVTKIDTILMKENKGINTSISGMRVRTSSSMPRCDVGGDSASRKRAFISSHGLDRLTSKTLKDLTRLWKGET